MVRLASVALLVAMFETPVWSQSIGPAYKPALPDAWHMTDDGVARPTFALPHNLEESLAGSSETRTLAGKQMSPNSMLGFGIFGPKRDRTALPPVTVYEFNIRQSRKPGVGFSFKF